MWGAVQVAVRPGACLWGEVALAGELQTSAVGCPIECVAAAAQALEAARRVDADVVTGPLEGALVDVCVATGRQSVGGGSGRGGRHGLPLTQPLNRHLCPTVLGPQAQRAHGRHTANVRLRVAAQFSILSPLASCVWVRSCLTSFLEVGRVEIF